MRKIGLILGVLLILSVFLSGCGEGATLRGRNFPPVVTSKGTRLMREDGSFVLEGAGCRTIVYGGEKYCFATNAMIFGSRFSVFSCYMKLWWKGYPIIFSTKAYDSNAKRISGHWAVFVACDSLSEYREVMDKEYREAVESLCR